MTDIRLDRTFWPVGHGAFYTECFYNRETGKTFTAVYDCGGKGQLRKGKKALLNSPFMEERVKEFFESNWDGNTPTIDVLFISHLHRDHINGIPSLLPQVKRIVLPQLEEEAYIESFVYNAITGNNIMDVESGIQSFIINLASGMPIGEARITRVRPNPDNVSVNDNAEGANFDTLGNVINSGTAIHIPAVYHKGRPFWVYIPVNLPIDMQKKETFLETLCKKLGTDIKNENGTVNWNALQEALRNADITEIKKIYEEYFEIKDDNHNFYSMPVFSGPISGVTYHWYSDYTNILDEDWFDGIHPRFFRGHILYNRRLTSCLYMGDFETTKSNKLRQLITELGDYYYRAGLQQVPHHYSGYNHDIELYEHRILAFGNVDDHKDISYCHHVRQEIQNVTYLSPLVITELDSQKTIVYKMYI